MIFGETSSKHDFDLAKGRGDQVSPGQRPGNLGIVVVVVVGTITSTFRVQEELLALPVLLGIIGQGDVVAKSHIDNALATFASRAVHHRLHSAQRKTFCKEACDRATTGPC